MMQKPFFVWQNRVLKKINPEQVICLATEGNYTKIFLSDKSHYLVRSTLAAALSKLPSDLFIKIHRSLAVSIYYVDDIARDHLVIGEQPLPISRQYYKSLCKQLIIIE